MWTWSQSTLLAVFFTTTLFLVPQLGACDNEPDDLNQEAVGIEQEFVGMVERYNWLLKERRFDEAIVLAKQAELWQPENPTARVMILEARQAKQADFERLMLSLTFKATLAAHVSKVLAGVNRIEAPGRIAERICCRLASKNGDDDADVQCVLDALLERRIEVVDQDCHLTDVQKRKLRIAGRGDIKRFYDRIGALQLTFQLTRATQYDELPDLELRGTGCFVNADTNRPGLFDRGSLFSKTLKTSLMEGQAGALEASVIQRK